MWEKAYNICFNTVQDNSLRWFQYKILNNTLGTKAYRFKVKLSDNHLCSLYSKDNKTSIHLFPTSEKVRIFWQNLKELILQETGFNFKINNTSIIFGYLSNDKVNIPANVLYMAAITYIFHI